MSVSSLYTAAAAVGANQDYLDVVANNLANVDTVAFKSGQASFADALSETLQLGANQAQVGLGVQLSAVTSNFAQGTLQSTSVPSDLAINGDGFFVVKDPTSGAISYTRAGNFTVDSQGFLVTPTGQRLQGAAPGSADGAALTDVQIPTAIGGVQVASYNIDTSGNVTAVMADNTTQAVAQISLQRFSNPNALANLGNNLFQASAAAGPMFGTAAAPVYQTAGGGGSGEIESGYLEMSNVDMAREFSNMIQAQRGLEANARVITTSDEILQDLLALKH